MPASGILKPKDLVLIPFRVALAAQADGWYVRSDIIWAKRNPMPESVTDRPTTSHEHILMLTKSARYYWDAEAVRENALIEPRPRMRPNGIGTDTSTAGLGADSGCGVGCGRNIRTVWGFATQPYPEAHFATFPEALPERCIKAATPEVGCCSECGAPWERVVGVDYKNDTTKSGRSAIGNDTGRKGKEKEVMGYAVRTRRIAETTGWQPTCECGADKVPSLVLDPFAGSGTTLLVAARLGRRSVGYELSEDYCAMAVKRNRQMVLGPVRVM
jgi:hypothetical protein